MRMCLFCVYHSVFHFIAYNIKPPASSQFLNGKLTIGVLKPLLMGAKVSVYGSCLKAKIRNYKAIDSSKKIFEK